MALLTARTVTAAGTTPVPVQCANGDTISGDAVGQRGLVLRVANTSGGVITVAPSDPGATPAGNPGTVTPVSVPATTGIREVYIGPANVNPVTNLVTLTYTGTLSASTVHEAVRY